VSLSALSLVLAAAVAHATWNLLAKRCGGNALDFAWIVNALSAALWVPAAALAVALERPELGWLALGFVAGSGALHLGYVLALKRGYGQADLSVVYPTARGTAPLLSTSAAVVFLGERPGRVAILGVALVGLGVLVLALDSSAVALVSFVGVGYGLLTGLMIASYTVWDAYAVQTLAIPPLLLEWASNLARATMLTPVAAARRAPVAALWRRHRRELVAIAILSPLAYVLVLSALVFTPVSRVAPTREVSTLLVAVIGARFLAEGRLRRRLPAAASIVAGIVLLTVT
jgi:drug/metabolite transporter (DMT)-like permease